MSLSSWIERVVFSRRHTQHISPTAQEQKLSYLTMGSSRKMLNSLLLDQQKLLESRVRKSTSEFSKNLNTSFSTENVWQNLRLV
jgi:hypothetical protein